tara:strand:+ start:77 stop:244 length:168 start_codon:yes stop_codon:yes gene_type:complete
VSKIIEEINPQANISGNDNPPRSGAFEVKINEELIFSKFSTGAFPTKEIIKSWFE